jgi:hypothetical protein
MTIFDSLENDRYSNDAFNWNCGENRADLAPSNVPRVPTLWAYPAPATIRVGPLIAPYSRSMLRPTARAIKDSHVPMIFHFPSGV